MIKIQVKLPEIKTDLKLDTFLGKFIKTLREYAVSITHIATGAWAGAHRSEVTGDTARVYIDPSATNPGTGQSVATYASVWENRGGEMAVYERTLAESSVLIGALQEEIAAGVFV